MTAPLCDTASRRQKGPEWPRITECTSALGIRTLLLVRTLFGERVFRWLLRPILAMYWLSSARLRVVVGAWQKRAHARTQCLAPWQGQVCLGSGVAQLERFALAILEKFIALSGNGRPAEVESVGETFFLTDPPDRAMVLLTSHTGCQELLLSRAGTVTNRPFVILQHTAHARRFNALLGEARRKNSSAATQAPESVFIEIGAELSPAVVMTLSEYAAKGACIVLAGDRVPMGSDAAQAVPFFGDKARFPTGGALLAMLLGVPLRMMICTRPSSAERRYRVRFVTLCEKPTRLRRNAREAWLAEMAAAYATTLEAELSTSPFDWANFFDFWEEFKA